MALKADRLTVQDNSTCWEDSNDVATIYNVTNNVGYFFCLHVAIGYQMLVCNLKVIYSMYRSEGLVPLEKSRFCAGSFRILELAPFSDLGG
jgi:hypothetical protein